MGGAGTMRSALTGLALAGVVAACQPAAVPIEQAKQTTADFGAPGFVAPPRTITDVTEILDREQPDTALIAERVRRADAPVPAGGAAAQQARFLFDRSFAAADLGRDQQRIDDLREALRLADAAKLPARERERYWWQLAYAYDLAGRPIERLEALDQRLAVAQSLGDSYPVTGIQASRRSALLYLGRFDEAAAANREMTRIIAVLGAGNPTAYQRADFERKLKGGEAALLRARGKDRAAEPLMHDAVQAAEIMAQKDPSEPNQRELESEIRNYATVLRSLGRLAESEVESRRGLSNALRHLGKDATPVGFGVTNLAFTVRAQGRLADAERLFHASLEIFEHAGHGPGSSVLASAYINLGETVMLRGRAAEAAEHFAKARELAPDDPTIEDRVGTTLWYAQALIEMGRPAPALQIANRAIKARSAVYGERSYSAALARAISAIALFELNDRSGALSALRAALPPLLARSSSSDSAGSPNRIFLQWILGRFLEVLSDHGRAISDSADLDAAFQIADASRGQQVQEALGAAAARSAGLDPGLAALIRAEQDERLEMAALEATLSNVLALPAERQRTEDVTRLRQQLDALRVASAARRSEIDRQFPAYAALSHPKPPSLEAARAALKPGEALIVTAVTDARSYVWAVPRSGAPAFAVATMPTSEIAARVARLRVSLDPDAARLADIPPYDVATAHALYRALLEPVRAGWRDAKSLVVVPDRALAQLPFGVLVTKPATIATERAGDALFAPYRDVPWLAREAAITQVPSVAALAALRTAPPPPASRQPFIGFGDPWFTAEQAKAATTQVASAASDETALRGGGTLRFRSAAQTGRMASADLADLPRLPETVEELRGIARALGADPAKDVLIGAAANERVVKTMNLADRRVVAFATHGLLPGDLNGLTQPALALSAPQVAGVEGDGLLTMDEVLGLKLNADWVVLSACNTAAGEGAGAEALSGLGRAFFYAGTRALLASNWPVETSSARALTTDLFRRQAADPGLARAEALRQAELALLDGPGFVDAASGKTVFSYAHPIFWAPFSLVGDGGGAAN